MSQRSGSEAVNGDKVIAMNGGTSASSSSEAVSSKSLIPEEIPNLSTSALESKLNQLREAASEHSQVLTQKLASSSSGQNLLHIGTSLSTLPPDLHTLLTHMHPFVNVLEGYEQEQRQALTALVEKATAIRHDQHRVRTAQRAADLYADLTAAEACVASNYKREVESESSGDDDSMGKCGSLNRVIDSRGVVSMQRCGINYPCVSPTNLFFQCT